MGKRKRNENRSFDRLPAEIIHHILSFLSPEKADQTSVLCKTWLHARSTYPNLNFNQHLFYRRLQARSGGQTSERSKKKKFVKFVDNNLAMYSKHNLPINSFVLFLMGFTSKWVSLVDKWLGTALDMGVEELTLNLEQPWLITDPLSKRRHRYSLPHKIFSAKQLTSLRVWGQTFNSDAISINLKENQALLGNLKSLHLSYVYLDEQTFQKLCSSCSLIEALTLDGCSGMKCIEVCHLPNLKNLHVTSGQQGQMVVITDTPSLEAVTCDGYRYDRRPPCFGITISASQFLKHLVLFYTKTTDAELGKIISQCPLLDSLNLKECNALTRVKITSQTLKSLTFYRCNRLAEATIDAPSLLSFWYNGDRIPSVSFISSLSKRFKSVIALYLHGDLDRSSFIRINSLLANLSNCGQFYVNISSTNICFNAEDLKEIQLLPQLKVESLVICSSSPSETYTALLDGLMWSCHPEMLETSSIKSPNADAFVSFLCKEVMEWRRLVSCSNSEGIMCCGQLYLNHIKVEYLELEDQDKDLDADCEDYLGDWKTLVDGSTFPKSVSELRFTLKW